MKTLENEILTIREAASYLRTTYVHLRTLISKFGLPAYEVSSMVRLSRRKIDEWLEAHPWTKPLRDRRGKKA